MCRINNTLPSLDLRGTGAEYYGLTSILAQFLVNGQMIDDLDSPGRYCGWMDGWIDGRMDEWTDGWMGGWMDGWKDERI